MNWAYDLVKLAANYHNDITNPAVVELGHKLWRSSNYGNFIVDGERYGSMQGVARAIHMSYPRFVELIIDENFGEDPDATKRLTIGTHELFYDVKAENFKTSRSD